MPGKYLATLDALDEDQAVRCIRYLMAKHKIPGSLWDKKTIRTEVSQTFQNLSEDEVEDVSDNLYRKMYHWDDGYQDVLNRVADCVSEYLRS